MLSLPSLTCKEDDFSYDGEHTDGGKFLSHINMSCLRCNANFVSSSD